MRSRKLLGFGIGGTAVTAVCCFTPSLVILLGSFGLSAWLAWLDYVLLPMLVAFIALTLFALLRIGRQSNQRQRDA
jgi:mercuric ion transport protein